MSIVIDKPSSHNVSEQIKDKNEEFKIEIAKLNNYVGIVNNAWSGSDADKYKMMMEEFSKTLTSMSEVIDEYAQYLSKVPGMYDVIDDVYNAKI